MSTGVIQLTDNGGENLTDGSGLLVIDFVAADTKASSVAALTDAEFTALTLNLMPRGLAWPREPDSLQYQVAAALAPTYTRLNDRANYLLVDAFPSTTSELLPEWEAALGLPDPCLGPNPLISERRAQVVARFTSGGGQSAPYYVGYAAALGYAITITQFSPARFGIAKFGAAMAGQDWAFAWRVTAPAVSIESARFGADRIGDRFRSWGSTVLECELSRIKPAHTILQFAYV